MDNGTSTKTPEDNGFQLFLNQNDRYNSSEENVQRRRSSIICQREAGRGRHCWTPREIYFVDLKCIQKAF